MFKRNDVGREFPDAFGEFVGRHGVFVEHPTEGFFIHRDFFDVRFGSLGGVEFFDDWLSGFLKFLEQLGRDGEEVAAGEFADLAGVAEAGAHHLCVVAEFFVVVENPIHRLHAGILGALVFFSGLGLVVVVNAADEGRDEAHACLGASNRLGHRKKEREVAVDSFFLADGCGLRAFPGRGDLNEDALARGAEFFVETDEVARLLDGGFDIEGKAGIDLGGNAAGDDREDFAAEGDEEVVDDLAVERGAGERAGAVVSDGFREERLVFGLLDGLENQRRIGRGVLRRVGADAFKVSRVGDDGGELLELVE